MSKPQAEPRQVQQFVGGRFVDAASGATLSIENPPNGGVIARVPASAAEDVERAVGSAAMAFESWRETTPQERSLAMLRVAATRP
jgi:betaine-aldehyde dehydrogenase